MGKTKLAGPKDVARFLWKLGPDANNVREMIMRLAAYNFYTKNPDQHGATRPSLTADLPAQYAAARKTRDLLIDYQNVSAMTRMLRDSSLIPFASWLVGNIQRYGGVARTVGAEIKASPARGLAGAAGTLFRMAALPVAAGLYAMNVNDGQAWEDLNEYDRRRGAIPFRSRTESGERRFMRMVTAEQDLADWVGAYEFPEIFDQIKRGAPLGNVIRKTMEAPISKLYNSLNPLGKLLLEENSGMTRFPNFFEPRPLTTPFTEGLAQVFGVKKLIYQPVNRLRGLEPVRPGNEGVLEWAVSKARGGDMAFPAQRAIEFLSNIRTVDPGETAMSDGYGIIARWFDAKGIDRPSTGITNDANMLVRRYKYAVRVGDEKTAKGLLPMIDAAIQSDPATAFLTNGKSTKERVQASVDRAHPFGSVSALQVRAIINEMPRRERDRMLAAYDHYLGTYKPSARERRKIMRIRTYLRRDGSLPVTGDPLVKR